MGGWMGWVSIGLFKKGYVRERETKRKDEAGGRGGRNVDGRFGLFEPSVRQNETKG